MKYIGFLALALLVTPSIAAAQDGPPGAPGAGAPPPAMRQMHAQMTELRRETRSQMLGALSSQHRALLASVVGQLATAPNPDVKAAAAQLDSALSPRESQAILASEASLHSQMRADMQQNGGPAGAMKAPPNGRSTSHVPDAGKALLHMALAFGGSMRPPHAP